MSGEIAFGLAGVAIFYCFCVFLEWLHAVIKKKVKLGKRNLKKNIKWLKGELHG